MNTEKLVSSAKVRRELGDVSNMTIWRWTKSGILPAPTKINGRNYWAISAVERIKAGFAKVDA